MAGQQGTSGVSSTLRNRFQDFYEEGKYTALKNHLYNYTLRKRAVAKAFCGEECRLILEAGSGISPMLTSTDRIVYSDLSFLGCRTLKRAHGRGWYVVADATRLPFRDGAFSHTVSSEVLEHVPDDDRAVAEMVRVLAPDGRLIVTFPHRKSYYANDDRYVSHVRRYEYREMEDKLAASGMEPVAVRKVLGPLEKLTMMFVVLLFSTVLKVRGAESSEPSTGASEVAARPRAGGAIFKMANQAYAALVGLDAWLWPRSMAACLLIKAKKRTP